MPAAVPLEDLERAHEELRALEMKYPDTYEEVAEFFQRNRGLGYSNLCKMLMGEQTPRELKGLEEEPAADESGADEDAGAGDTGAATETGDEA